MEPSTPQASVSSLTLPGKSERLRPPLPPRAADLAFPDSGLPSPASPPPAWPAQPSTPPCCQCLADMALVATPAGKGEASWQGLSWLVSSPSAHKPHP